MARLHKMKLDASLQAGEVALVGAGPGDASLLTLAAARLLSDCDVIVYDALVSDEVMEMVGKDVERIFAGKRGGKPSATQQDICEELVRLARAGKRVVRLKGGDPFVFGRGGEEIRALSAAAVRFRIIPGITAGLAAPAMAGIPVTDRTVNATLGFVTGCEAGGESRVDWRALVAAFPVLVIYMGTRNLPAIARSLLDAGMKANTPMSILRSVTNKDESHQFGTLSEAASGDLVGESPSIVVIGEVVNVRREWREAELG